MNQFNLALRRFHLAVNLESLHGNCEQPGCYSTLLVCMDSVLPAKGVNYRLPKSGHSRDVEDPSPGKDCQVRLERVFWLDETCEMILKSEGDFKILANMILLSVYVPRFKIMYED